MIVVDKMKKVVARRSFVMDPKGARCLCLWYCACFCFGSFLTNEVNALCQIMPPKNEFYAGFYDETDLEEIKDVMEHSTWIKTHLTVLLPLAMLMLALLLGELIQVSSDEFLRKHHENTSACSKEEIHIMKLPKQSSFIKH